MNRIQPSFTWLLLFLLWMSSWSTAYYLYCLITLNWYSTPNITCKSNKAYTDDNNWWGRLTNWFFFGLDFVTRWSYSSSVFPFNCSTEFNESLHLCKCICLSLYSQSQMNRTFFIHLNVPQRDIFKVFNTLVNMGGDKYACFILYVCYCKYPQ